MKTRKGLECPILLERDDLLIVDKAPGIAVIPERYEEADGRDIVRMLEPSHGKLYVVHRLDRETSGCLVLARQPEAHRSLSLAFQEGRAEKRYLAFLAGAGCDEAWEADYPLLPDGDREHRTIVDMARGKPSRSAFRRLKDFGRISLVEARPFSGRTHQIRVHAAASGHPVLCDPLYGSGEPLLLSSLKRSWRGDAFEERPLIARLALHAASLSIPDPRGGEAISVEAPLRRDMAALLKQLEKIGSVRG
jgi:RluA family pseudouridine synthase